MMVFSLRADAQIFRPQLAIHFGKNLSPSFHQRLQIARLEEGGIWEDEGDKENMVCVGGGEGERKSTAMNFSSDLIKN